MSFDYTAVLAELRSKRDLFNTAIAAMEKVADEQHDPAEAPAPRKYAKRRKNLTVVPRPSKRKEVASEPGAETPRMSLSDAVRSAAAEPIARTSIELTDRVQEILPHANRASIQSQISMELRAGRLHKTDDLKVRPVINGRVA